MKRVLVIRLYRKYKWWCFINKSIIKINNLEFSYLDKVIFNDFNLEIKEGDFVSLIGNNGSGKSTLLKIISGIVSAKGDIYVNSFRVNKEEVSNVRKLIGYINNELDNFFISNEVIMDLVFSLENLCYSKNDIDIELKNIVKLFELEDVLDRNINEISRKKRVIVALACVLIYKPKILLLDEVIDTFNSDEKRDIFRLLLNYKKKYNLTIIMVTHDMEDTLYGNRIILINSGKLCLDATIKEFYGNIDRLKHYGINIPFVVRLSYLLMDKGVISHVYTDIYELVGELWV